MLVQLLPLVQLWAVATAVATLLEVVHRTLQLGPPLSPTLVLLAQPVLEEQQLHQAAAAQSPRDSEWAATAHRALTLVLLVLLEEQQLHQAQAAAAVLHSLLLLLARLALLLLLVQQRCPEQPPWRGQPLLLAWRVLLRAFQVTAPFYLASPAAAAGLTVGRPVTIDRQQ
jgi:hypothetical protein